MIINLTHEIFKVKKSPVNQLYTSIKKFKIIKKEVSSILTFARMNASCSPIEKKKAHIKPTSILKFQNNMYTQQQV